MQSEHGEFDYPRSNVITSQSGFTVEVKPPTGIRYTEAHRHMEIFAEVLVSDVPKIAVRRTDLRAWEPPDQNSDLSESDRDRILDNIQRAFEYRGWVLTVD